MKGGPRARLKETQEREAQRRQALVRIEDERFNRRLSALNERYALAIRRLDKISRLNEDHYQRKAAVVKEMADGHRLHRSPPPTPRETTVRSSKVVRKFAEASAKAKTKKRKRPR